MKTVPLTNGGVALVDDVDYERVLPYSWTAHQNRPGGNVYVRCQNKLPTSMYRMYLHRYILRVPKGEPLKIDHRNGNGLDNQRANLRPVTSSQNGQNRRGLDKDNKTGVRGVSWNAALRKYQVTIQIQGRSMYLGIFPTLEEAREAAVRGRQTFMTHSQN